MDIVLLGTRGYVVYVCVPNLDWTDVVCNGGAHACLHLYCLPPGLAGNIAICMSVLRFAEPEVRRNSQDLLYGG